MKGYEGNGFACAEKDPCKSNPCDIHATCRKTGPNKASCDCGEGFAGNGYACKEIDPCEKDPCDPHAVCIKTSPGQHTCVCKAGYRQNPIESQKCDEIDPCQDYPCDKHATCKKTRPGAFMCTCNTGFVQDGNKCLEVNSCSKLPFPCHANAECIRTGPGAHVCMCKVGYDGDGKDQCNIKPGWEAVLKAADPSLASLAGAIGPDGLPVLKDSQQQRDLRNKLEEEKVKAQFAGRERERTRRIHELQTRIMEYEEMRRHRKVAEDNAAVHRLERRVEAVAKSAQEINSQKETQMKLLNELKSFELQQEEALKQLVQEKSDLVLEKAKEEARRLAALARRPQFPDLSPRDPNVRAVRGQNYADNSSVPGHLPAPAAKAASASTAVQPLVAGSSDIPSQGAGSHQSPAEAAAAGGAVIPSIVGY